jgi:hypothetical protein
MTSEALIVLCSRCIGSQEREHAGRKIRRIPNHPNYQEHYKVTFFKSTQQHNNTRVLYTDKAGY